MSENNGRDTDKSELGEGDRKTPVDQPLTLEALLAEVQGALGESNALSILAREASNVARVASERCSSLCVELLERIRGDELRTAGHERRLQRLEERAGLAAE